MGAPCTGPKAHVSAVISISIGVWFGTLTAAGTKPRPQQEPGKTT